MAQAKLESLEALEQFRTTWKAFTEQELDLLEHIRFDFLKKESMLMEEMPQYWRQQLLHWQEELRDVQLKLSMHGVGRSKMFLQERRREAKMNQRKAEEKLQLIKKWQMSFTARSSSQLAQLIRTRSFFVGLGEKAAVEMDNLIETLRRYLEHGAGS